MILDVHGVIRLAFGFILSGQTISLVYIYVRGYDKQEYIDGAISRICFYGWNGNNPQRFNRYEKCLRRVHNKENAYVLQYFVVISY